MASQHTHGATHMSVPAGLFDRSVDVNGWPAVISAILLGTVGVLSFIIQPGIVEGFVRHLHLGEADAVNLVGLEMLGVAVATVVLAAWGNLINWRVVVIGGLALAAGGDIASALGLGAGGHSASWFGMARLVAGLGEGAIISISFTFVGLTAKTERNVALYLVSLLAYGAFGLWYLPQFLDAFGFYALFLGFAALSLAGMVAICFVPRAYHHAEMANPTARQLPLALLIVALGGVLAYNLAQGIAWAVLALVGGGAGLGEQQVADALFLSQILAIAGALASVFLADRVNRNGAIAFGILVGAASIALLLGRPTALLFTMSVCGFNILWNFVLPFILGRICDFDESGRIMSFAIAMQMTGLGGGPLIAGQLLNGNGYRAVELVCIALFLVSYALLVAPMRAHRRLLQARPNA